jgi:TPR repeat protein
MKIALKKNLTIICLSVLFLCSCGGDYLNKALLAHNDKDYVKAKDMYEVSCKSGSVYGCNGLGKLYFEGEGVEQDYDKANQIFQKTCENKSGYGCRLMGMLYAEGSGVELNYKKAVKYYKKACSYQDATGCLNIAKAHYSGIGVKEDLQKAASYSLLACNLQEKEGCDMYKELQQYSNVTDFFKNGSHYAITDKIKQIMFQPESYRHIETLYHLDKDKNIINVKTEFNGKVAKNISKYTVIATVDLKGNILYFDIGNY